MERNISKDKNKDNQNDISNANLKSIKSNYILKKIYANLEKKKSLRIVKYNKNIQNRLNLDIKDYEIFLMIEIEIIPCEDTYGKFINVKEEDKIYYHIYFNDNKEEIKNEFYIYEGDKVSKIKIIIDYQVKSFEKLFQNCKCIKSINFKKFYNNNINNMSWMFYGCSSLNKLNISNFITNNVNNMRSMFKECSLLKQLNLSNFNTYNVTNMSWMFSGCSSLKKLNLSNFNTYNVTNMSYMFYKCLSLKELNLPNFNTNNATDMFKMLSECSNYLKNKIRLENKNIMDEAFF